MILQTSVFKMPYLSFSHLNIPRFSQLNILEVKSLSEDGDEIMLLRKEH